MLKREGVKLREKMVLLELKKLKRESFRISEM